MNYIRHLNAFFSLVKTDNRLTASHVSLYLALFHYWNFNRFNNPFSIYRENIMQLSKIGSKNTYHKCIKELHNAKYIYYHPAPTKFQVVRISVIRLDTEQEKPNPYKQLDLFGTDIDTGIVPKLIPASTDFDTDTVSKMGHLYKPNINKQRETPAHLIFEKNKKIQNAINILGSVPNPGHPGALSFRAERGSSNTAINIPSQTEIEIFFQNENYPTEEAIKFFNHYKALGWKLQGKTPILDWKPLVEKWMTNAKKWEASSPSLRGAGPAKAGESAMKQFKYTEVNFLYESFLEGKNIFRYITSEHFDQLKLKLTNEILQQAWKQRINQVSGTNQHSLNDLWQAYLTGDPENVLIEKDKPNLIALAKRLAVLNQFYNLRQSGSPLSPQS
jgi:hypothetical protein